MSYKSLIINPGSTSTKIGVFEDETLLFEETLRHSTEEIAQYDSIVAQKDFRKDVIAKVLAENNFDIKTLDVVVGRGGLLKPIPGGTYTVTDELVKDLVEAKRGEHASCAKIRSLRQIIQRLADPVCISVRINHIVP